MVLASCPCDGEVYTGDRGYAFQSFTLQPQPGASATSPGVAYNAATRRNQRNYDGKSVRPIVTFRALPLPAPQTFLNEARLSALALAVYFAGRQISSATLQADTPRLMVLDDVLIGLDQSNRLPVLQVLEKHFSGWQIVLLTYDRVWFEMARFHLADRKDWDTLELFEGIEPTGASRPILRPTTSVDPVVSNISTARKFYADHYYAASAVHARVAFELSLKKVCERNAIAVRFRVDQRMLTTDDLLIAVEKGLTGRAEAGLMAKSIQDIKLYRKVVLNPFSHSTPINLTAVEVKGAIDAVEALHRAFREHIKGGASS